MIIIDSFLDSDERVLSAANALRSKDEDVRLMSKDSMETLLDAGTCKIGTSFVLAEFDGNLFHRLEQSQGFKILGKTIFLDSIENDRPLPVSQYPVYSHAFCGLNIAFNTMPKSQLQKLIELVRWMGGKVMDLKTGSMVKNCDQLGPKSDRWRLVANNVFGPSFRCAVSRDISVVSMDYVKLCWNEKRHLPSFRASCREFTQLYRRKPFEECKIHFVGFSAECVKELLSFTLRGGGGSTEAPLEATHVMVAPNTPILEEINEKARIVTEEWFWHSIRIEARVGEKSYYPPNLDTVDKTPNKSIGSIERSPSAILNELGLNSPNQMATLTPQNSNHGRKRRKNFGNSQEDFDTLSDPLSLDDGLDEVSGISEILSRTGLTPRHRADLYEKRDRFDGEPPKKLAKAIAKELFDTELNYVKLLRFTVFDMMGQLEDPNQVNGAILNKTECGTIFGNLPDLLALHENILDDLQITVDQISIGKQASIGECMLKYAENIREKYKNYIGFMDQSKREREYLKEENDRFTAFLKLKEKTEDRNSPARQGFDGLLIAPVQRLPRYVLLLKSYRKELESENVETLTLSKAIEEIHDINLEVNKFTAEQDHYRELFDIVNQIEGCPPRLLSSSRRFIKKCDVIVVRDNEFTKLGDHLALFIFNDCIEVTKRRRRKRGSLRTNSARPQLRSGASTTRNVKQYLYDHRELIYYSMDSENVLEYIWDILESDRIQRCFALVSRQRDEKASNITCVQPSPNIDKQELMNELKSLILSDRNNPNENEDANENQINLIETIEGTRLKIGDTTNLGKGFLRNIGRKMSFRGDLEDYDNTLKRYDSQASLASFSSISSHFSVKSEYCSPNSAFGRMRSNTAFESNLKPSSSMFNLPDIPKKMIKPFASPFRKLRNTFSRPSTPKGKARSQSHTFTPNSKSADVNKN